MHEEDDNYKKILQNIFHYLKNDKLLIESDKCMKNLSPEVANHSIKFLEKYINYIRDNI